MAVLNQQRIYQFQVWRIPIALHTTPLRGVGNKSSLINFALCQSDFAHSPLQDPKQLIFRWLTCNIYHLCKCTYASVRPDRHTCSNYCNLVANMDATDCRCRWTGKIIARDLRLVASWHYTIAVTQPRMTCRNYSIPLFRHRPPGLHKRYQRKLKKWKRKVREY